MAQSRVTSRYRELGLIRGVRARFSPRVEDFYTWPIATCSCPCRCRTTRSQPQPARGTLSTSLSSSDSCGRVWHARCCASSTECALKSQKWCDAQRTHSYRIIPPQPSCQTCVAWHKTSCSWTATHVKSAATNAAACRCVRVCHFWLKIDHVCPSGRRLSVIYSSISID